VAKKEDYRIQPGTKVKLGELPTRDDGGLDKEEGKARLEKAVARLTELQELLYAEHRHALLVVFQAMDAGGKDSTIRNVFGPLNPQGCRVWSFKVPTPLELDHDFLWRIHEKTPRRGMITVFNRSHYEDVGVVRVKGFVPKERWKRRYGYINGFEKLLHEEGTRILKFWLHIGKDYQKERFQRRLDRPDKHWKFNPGDLDDRALWDDFMEAYGDAISKCSTDHAPWYVIPAERRWYRNLLVAETVRETLESLDMKYPEPDYDASKITL
jgi:PPK2 family polyphosphate:nucleotide phosphotransferase